MGYQPFVYALSDPEDIKHIRYVGMAPTNPQRPYNHAKRAKRQLEPDTHLIRWIRLIQEQGREPAVTILETLAEGTDRHFLGFVESCYIKSLREIGHKLTNENDGGWGGSNGPHKPESMEKMKAGWTPEVRARVGEISRQRQTGFVHSLESRKKHSETVKGRPKSDETKEAMATARRAAWKSGIYDSPEYREKLRLGQLGRIHSDECRKKQSLSEKEAWARKIANGYKVSDEHRANNSAAQTGKKASEKTREKMRLSRLVFLNRIDSNLTSNKEIEATVLTSKTAPPRLVKRNPTQSEEVSE